jgi:hypothetical protein
MKLISGAKISSGVRSIDPKTSSLANVIDTDRRRKEEEKKVRRQEELNKQINTNLEKFQKQNQLGWGGKILKFLGLDYSQPLPNLASENPEYTKARQESESAYDVNQEVIKTWKGEAAKTVGKGLLSAAKMSPLVPAITEEQKKEKDALYIGAGKNLAQLATGTAKVALQAGMLPTQLGSKISEKLFGHSVDEVKKAEAFIDNNGILNYKPEYKNEAQKMGGQIAELGSWFIPITRFGKVAEGERILATALKDIPLIEKMFGKTPKIVKTGGKFFFEVGKDAADVAVLDAIRGKNWEEIKTDMPSVIVGGTLIRGGGKMIAANRVKKQAENAVESLTKAVGDLTPEEIKVVNKAVEEGSTLDTIARDILEKRTELGVTGVKNEVSTLETKKLSKIATNSLENEKIGIKPGAVERAKAEIKAGTSKPIQVRYIEGKPFIEDGRNRLQAYKELGIKEIPFEDVTSKYEKPARVEKPETVKAKTAMDIEARAIENKLIKEGDFGELAEVAKMKMKKQAMDATELMNKDYKKAVRIAEGLEEPEGSLRAGSVFVAVRERAMKEGDVITLEKLAKSKIGTEAGQALKAFDAGLRNDPVGWMSDVIKHRKDAIVKKVGNTKIAKEGKAIKENIAKRVRKNMPTKEDWNKFITDITCK